MLNKQDILEPIPPHQRWGISWLGLLLGLVLGLGVGLYYSRVLDPVVVRNVAPEDLQAGDQRLYVLAIAHEYRATGDLRQATDRLLAAEPGRNPFEWAAEMTCALVRSGAISSVTDIEAVRSLRTLYESQGVPSQCDLSAFSTPVRVTVVQPTPTITPTPTFTPAASKTPTQPFQATRTPEAQPLSVPADNAEFRVVFIEPFCSPETSGLLEVYVQENGSGVGIPGVAIEVSWRNAQRTQVFYSGLKPERGNDYADFVMDPAESYRVRVIANSSELSRALEAVPCDDQGTLTGYRVVIRRFS
ncbi:MAG: hypothetical protein HC915_11740 [Anaerolineae bacterium]|nr:hypothetical protein [Anaerolineae bacterium]